MGLFNEILSSDESLFKNEVALSYDYIPKLVPYREQQQRYIADCIKPLFQQRNGKNIFVYGKAGVGKTVACKHLFNEIEEESEEVIPVYINCWSKNTTYKIVLEMCDLLGYKLTHNKKTEELFRIIKQIINKKCVVFAFDEIDKAEDYDFLYTILEEIYRKTIILITNHRKWLVELDDRIKSRLTPDSLEFKPYNAAETRGILKQRLEYAFIPNVFTEDAFDIIAKNTAELQDIRTGLYMLKEAGTIAEGKSSRKILLEHAKLAIEKAKDFKIKSSSDLEDELRDILNIIKTNSDKKIGDLYKLFIGNGSECSYKSFQRKIKKLEKDRMISLKKTEGGELGNTTIVSYKTDRKLSEF
jgi:cell division control protein 6